MPDPTAIPPCSACSEPIPDPAERWPAFTTGTVCQVCWEAQSSRLWWAMVRLAATNAYALPTVHLNGTGAKSLADEYHAVYQAIDRVSDALAAATCNARDFYPQGAAAWQQARDERAEMFRKLAEVQAYAEAWMARASDHL